MAPKERLPALLGGKPVDRIPIYTQIPFAVGQDGMRPGPFHGYDDFDAWREMDPRYCALVELMERECDNAFIWRPPCMQNLQFFAPVDATRTHPADRSGERYRFVTEVALRDRTLRETREVLPGSGHSWQTEHLCTSIDDALALADVDWRGAPVAADDFTWLEQALGDLGIMWVTIPSPIMTVCRLFEPMKFLMLCRTDVEAIDRLISLAAERIRSNLEGLLDLGVGPVIRFGGAEHATPPLMGPDDFDRLVVAPDTPLVELCRSRGRHVAYHCHGNLRHALKRFREMGVRQIDPTETVPDGDITIEEAREIAGSEVILAGNVQCRELFSDAVGPEVIRQRVREFIEGAGPEDIIVTTTGSIIEPVSARTEEKYRALISEVRTSAPG